MSFLLALTAVVASGQTFACTPTAVYDGDGPIWCAEGPRIRLSGIAAREMDGTCRMNQPCPDASAERSRNQLASLVGKRIGRRPEGHILVKGPTMQCRSEGNGVGKRTAAWCVSRSVGARSVTSACAPGRWKTGAGG